MEHDYSKSYVFETPTCTKTGIEHIQCVRCYSIIERNLPKKHEYADGFCTLCGIEEPPFPDVYHDCYYYDAVKWALAEGITNGLTPTQFGPDEACTRAEVVTFLWRAAGCPEPTTAENPFSDVEEGKWYYDAVLWAVEEGITEGYEDTDLFGTGDTCTRGQIATFLYRCAKEPVLSSTENPFTDLNENAFYYTAVLWAVENGITNGYADTTEFGPMNECTRGQIVTFLYRVYN